MKRLIVGMFLSYVVSMSAEAVNLTDLVSNVDKVVVTIEITHDISADQHEWAQCVRSLIDLAGLFKSGASRDSLIDAIAFATKTVCKIGDDKFKAKVVLSTQEQESNRTIDPVVDTIDPVID